MAPAKRQAIIATIVVVALIAAAAGGLFIKDKMAMERFLDDFNGMNTHYKQALFQTGQGNRDAASTEYEQFIASLSAFRERYASSRPGKLDADTKFNSDLDTAEQIAKSASDDVRTGDLGRAHTTLEGVRPIFNELLRRNGLSSVSVALVDFHDSMEQVLDAGNDKDAALVIARYEDADGKLRAVEAELNDTGVQAIRAELDKIRDLAEKGDTETLPEQASKLKASYVKVYLRTG